MSVTIGLDRCVRAMTNDGGFRLVVVTLNRTTSDAAAAQAISAPTSERLGELLAGTILLRETTSPTRRVQVSLRERTGAKLVADSLADGLTRGLVNPGSGETANSNVGRRMEVTYSQRNGAMHKGIVEIADDTDISAAMMTYLQESEQILSTFSVAAHEKDAEAINAAGFVVQLLPELERSQLRTMTERLAELETLAEQLRTGPTTVESIVERIFDDFEYTVLNDAAIRFGCNCSRERFLQGLGTLAREEIDSMIDEDQPIELRCDGCGKAYDISVAELKEV